MKAIKRFVLWQLEAFDLAALIFFWVALAPLGALMWILVISVLLSGAGICK